MHSLKKAEPKFDEESLKRDVDNWLDKWLDKASDSTTDVITQAVLRTASSIANILLHNKALLLPKACQIFLEFYGVEAIASDGVGLILETNENEVKFSSRWLLNQLVIILIIVYAIINVWLKNMV